MNDGKHVQELISRLARLGSSEGWEDGLNPVQRSVLSYLSRANRFSRSPSHVAAYLGSTRGTVSQTLKSLAQKGYVAECRSPSDKRVVRYELTDGGRVTANVAPSIADHIDALPRETRSLLADALQEVLRRMVSRNGGKAFGECKSCRHFLERQNGGYCQLLSEKLALQEIHQICYEQEPA